MNEEEFEEWVSKNPMLANAVCPVCIVLCALVLQAGLIAFISWMLYIHSFPY